MGTAIVGIILAVIVIAIIASMVKRKKAGKSIHCNCSDCSCCGGSCEEKK